VSAWLSNLFWEGQFSSSAGQIFPVKAREKKQGTFQAIYFVQEKRYMYTFQQTVEKNMKSEKQITD
jgi:hypothetical protein